MTDQKQKIDVDFQQLVTLAGNILQQGFIKNPRDKAKQLFKDLKHGKRVSPGTIKLGGSVEAPLKLELDSSEWCGPGFNFNVFEAALKAMMSRIGEYIREKKEFNIMTSDNGSVLLNMPGIIKVGEQFNVMMMTFELGTPGEITLRLMFVDPDQFESLKPQAVEAAAANEDDDE